MTIYAVATGKIEFEKIFGISRCLEHVLHSVPVEAGDYAIGHAFLSLDFRVEPNDSVLLALKSIKESVNPNYYRVGNVKFGGSPLPLRSLTANNETLSILPKIGQPAIEVGPDKDGVTFSLVRYEIPSQAPFAIGQRMANRLVKR